MQKPKTQGLHNIICVNVVDVEWQLQTENRWNDNIQFIGPFKLILQYPRGSWLITPNAKKSFQSAIRQLPDALLFMSDYDCVWKAILLQVRHCIVDFFSSLCALCIYLSLFTFKGVWK